MRSRQRLALVALVAAVVLVIAACSSGTTKSLAVSDAWARAQADTTKSSATYLVISNPTDQADALLSATSPGAMVEMHQTSTDASGMTGMHPVDKIEVPAGGEVRLQPGGFHLMLMSLAKPLAVGDKLEIDLVFEHAGRVVVQAEVRSG
jgi:periplasmic copper chaperone A